MQRYSNLRLVQRLSYNLRTLSTSDLPRKSSENPYRSLCKLTLIGRTGAVPELREFDGGKQVLSLRVATNLTNGETQWHNVSVAEDVPGFGFLQQLPTGAHVYIEGNLRMKNVMLEDGNEKMYVNVNVFPGTGTLRVLGYPRRVGQDNDNDDLPAW